MGWFNKSRKEAPLANQLKPSLSTRLLGSKRKKRKYEVELEITYKDKSISRLKYIVESYSTRKVRKDFTEGIDFEIKRIKNI